MEGDISKRTITVLVALTVIISLLGALSVMSAMVDANTNPRVSAVSGPQQGYVALGIIGKEEVQKNQAPLATGHVALEIIEKIPEV